MTLRDETRRKGLLSRARHIASGGRSLSREQFVGRLMVHSLPRESRTETRARLTTEAEAITLADDMPQADLDRYLAIKELTLAPDEFWVEPKPEPLVLRKPRRTRLDEIEDTLAYLLEPGEAPAADHALESLEAVQASLQSAAHNKGEDTVPPDLESFMEADETIDEFRKRMWTMVTRFGVEEGEHGYDYPPLNADERKAFIPMLVANFKAGNWLKLDETLKPA